MIIKVKNFRCIWSMILLSMFILTMCFPQQIHAKQLPATAVSAGQTSAANDLPVLPPEVCARLFVQDGHRIQAMELPSSPQDFLKPGPWDAYREIPSENPEIVQLVADITSGLDSDSKKSLAIYEWVVNNISYDFSYSVSQALETLHKRTGICNGYSLLLAAMMRAGGIPCRFVAGAANGLGGWPAPGEINHAWNEIYLNGQWFSVDVTWDSCGKSSIYYLIDEKTFSVDHHKIMSNLDFRSFVYSGQDLHIELSPPIRIGSRGQDLLYA